jgi:hypothetical protein
MDGVFVIFAVIAEARFCTKEGEDQKENSGLEFRTDQESKVHAIMSSEASTGCQHCLEVRQCT